MAKISLCMICGNEENIILRCLESAAAAFDELCLVRAVGDQVPDQTIDVAKEWCSENGKTFRGAVYHNRVKGLLHVDNFGAARNKSFELATGGWLMWLDCDDYLDDINCRRIREAVNQCPAEWNGLMCGYLIEKDGAEIMRERLLRASGSPRWKNAIHETCVVDGAIGECPQIRVYHSDHTAKHKSSAQRNRTILDRVLEDAPRHYFYLHAELKMLGETEKAIHAGRAALATLGDHQIEERYLVHLNLSELEHHKCTEHLMNAAKLQPHRREAFAYLCQKSLNDGRMSDAISYFRLMDSLPLPSPLPWTHQGIWYGWARNALRVRILLENGQSDQADQEHAKHMADPDYAAGFGKFIGDLRRSA